MEAPKLLIRWWRPAMAVALMAVAVLFRLVRAELGAPPNLELITSVTMASVVLLGGRYAFAAPLGMVIVSDVILGNTSVMVFTWSAWLVVGVSALLVQRTHGWRRVGVATGLGLGSSVWFFLWTNGGVWLQSRGTWYSAGIDGLMDSYLAGLPFFRTMLLGNLVLVPALAGFTVLCDYVHHRITLPFELRPATVS